MSTAITLELTRLHLSASFHCEREYHFKAVSPYMRQRQQQQHQHQRPCACNMYVSRRQTSTIRAPIVHVVRLRVRPKKNRTFRDIGHTDWCALSELCVWVYVGLCVHFLRVCNGWNGKCFNWTCGQTEMSQTWRWSFPTDTRLFSGTKLLYRFVVFFCCCCCYCVFLFVYWNGSAWKC